MALTSDNVKTALYLGVGAMAIYAIKNAVNLQQAGKTAIKPVTDLISKGYDAIRFAGDRVQATEGGLVLRNDYFENGVISQSRLDALASMHEKNPEIIAFSFTQMRTLKEPYLTWLKKSDILLIKPDGTTESI